MILFFRRALAGTSSLRPSTGPGTSPLRAHGLPSLPTANPAPAKSAVKLSASAVGLELFPEGENRGRGARAGAEIWGNARSPGWNASRGTPEAVNSALPSPRGGPHSSLVHPPETLHLLRHSGLLPEERNRTEESRRTLDGDEAHAHGGGRAEGGGGRRNTSGRGFGAPSGPAPPGHRPPENPWRAGSFCRACRSRGRLRRSASLPPSLPPRPVAEPWRPCDGRHERTSPCWTS